MNANAYFAGNDSFRAARDSCIAACLAYNDKAEKVSPKERGALWLKSVHRHPQPKSAPILEIMSFAYHSYISSSCTNTSTDLPSCRIVSPNEAPKTTTAEQMFNDPSLKPQVPFVKVPVFMDYGLRVHIGGSTFINRGFKVLDSPVADVTIGEGCLFGPDVTIISVSHPLRAEDRAEAKTGRTASYGKPVQVGDDVWVGARVIIL